METDDIDPVGTFANWKPPLIANLHRQAGAKLRAESVIRAVTPHLTKDMRNSALIEENLSMRILRAERVASSA